MMTIKCDPAAGACELPDPRSSGEAAARATAAGRAVVHYVADPMCSWCWGISPTIGEVAAFCETEGIGFAMTMGGLRVGGGEPWNEALKAFLRREWRQISEVTGQLFGYSLLDAADFDYDTEPACRAVVSVQLLQARHGLASATTLKFFSALQRKFYVEGQDPKELDFYAGICATLGVDFTEFRTLFVSLEAARAVEQAFVRCRRWGVRSFPTLLLERDGARRALAVGFVTAAQLLPRLRQELAA